MRQTKTSLTLHGHGQNNCSLETASASNEIRHHWITANCIPHLPNSVMSVFRVNTNRSSYLGNLRFKTEKRHGLQESVVIEYLKFILEFIWDMTILSSLGGADCILLWLGKEIFSEETWGRRSWVPSREGDPHRQGPRWAERWTRWRARSRTGAASSLAWRRSSTWWPSPWGRGWRVAWWCRPSSPWRTGRSGPESRRPASLSTC